MAKLSIRIRIAPSQGNSLEAHWQDKLFIGEGGAEDNPAIPSGYTYLLQLMAHDLVETGPAALLASGDVANARFRPLMLDTIYGSGPDGCGHAYDVRDRVENTADFPDLARAPRRFLRTQDPVGAKPAPTLCCPFRDIARSTQPVHVMANGTVLEEACDPMIADQRNDAHAIISQLAVLFHALHNSIAKRVQGAMPAVAKIEMAYRRFECARALVTLIYRRIVLADVLPRILHPDVLAFYTARRYARLIDAPFDGVTAEFSRGAFRFGHAMIRENYVINRRGVVPDGKFLSLNSLQNPRRTPLHADWMVDWAFFFDLRDKGVPDAPQPNFSRRIGPRYSDAIEVSDQFEPTSDQDTRGLLQRDLNAALHSRMLPVPAFLSAMRQRLNGVEAGLGDSLAPDYQTVWRGKIEAWLGANAPPVAADALSAAEITALADSPPWPFFIAMEASLNLHADPPSTRGMGQHLGLAGSFIVAENILGALQAQQIVAHEHTRPLGDSLRAISQQLLGHENALPGLTDHANPPQSMADLLIYMKDAGIFAP
ncbi:MAG: peroxidase family protein [Beijerinckiaceae bacterium]